MEQSKDLIKLLNLIERPAFYVENGVVRFVNTRAKSLFLEENQSIQPLLYTGQAEYLATPHGFLSLKLKILDRVWEASVTPMETGDIFTLTEAAASPELQAMALVAQHLRSSISPMLTAAEALLPSGLIQENPEAKEQAAQISLGLHQLLRNIGNMADAGKYQSQEVFHKETVDIDGLVGEIMEKARHFLEAANIRLEYQGLSFPLYCQVHRELLERGIYNLISNSAKFTPAGETIRASLTRQGTRLYFTLENPASQEALPNPAQAFSGYLRQPSIGDGRQGIGLGMVLVRAAASAHGGALLLDYTPQGNLRAALTMEIDQSTSQVRSPMLRVDYSGERDHGLIELSDILPPSCY